MWKNVQQMTLLYCMCQACVMGATDNARLTQVVQQVCSFHWPALLCSPSNSPHLTMTIDESSPAVHDSDGDVSQEEREKRLAAALEEQTKVEKLAASRLFFVR